MAKMLAILRSLHKRTEFPLLTMIVALLTTNCATIKPLPSELQRYDLAREVSSSELDGIYDSSRLKVGDEVSLRGKIINTYENKLKSFLLNKKLIEIDPSAQNYIVDILTVYQNGDGLLKTIEAKPFRIQRISLSGPSSKTLKESKIESDQLDPIVRTALKNLLIGGIMGFSLDVISEVKKKHSLERYNQARKEHEHENYDKIIKLDQISNEELTVGARRIFCKVYQIDIITKGIAVSSSRSEPFYTVIDESIKVWVSDDVPFGVVKLDGKAINHWGLGKKPLETTINYELIDFKD